MLLAGSEQQEVRAALQRLLESRTFRRSDQLKKLVAYLCEAEIQGRRQDLDEYRIAVGALGRPEDFSPEVDSSVRTRTHALRQRLAEYYSSEGSEEKLRIELPKGSYVPVFHTPESSPAIPVPIAAPRLPGARNWAAYGLLAMLFTLAAVLGTQTLVLGPAWTTSPVVREFWRPVLSSGQRTAICVAQPVHLWVRNYGQDSPPAQQYNPFPDPVPASPRFQQWYQSRTGVLPGAGVVLHPSPNSPLWGDSAGASSAMRFLAEQRVSSDLLPESTLRNGYSLKGRNTLIFGRAEFSELVGETTPPGGFLVRYLPVDKRHGIVHAKDASRRFFNSIETDRENYGLVTVLRPDNDVMQIVFSGVTSDGSLAGMEFLASAEGLQRLKRELGNRWPPRFQLVIRTRSINGYPVQTEYATHHIF